MRTLGLTLLLVLATFTLAAADEPPASVRVYALDCGRIEFKDMGFFSDTADLDGKGGTVADGCFVIRHPKGTLLWDTGLGDALAAKKGGADVAPGIHATVEHTLVEQLAAIGLKPADVTYVALSHTHVDHTGNVNLFGASTFILNKAEMAWASGPSAVSVMPDTLSVTKTAKTQMIDGDHDVFGDGTVRILRTPGHTPGHQSLLVKLKKGYLVLSGDLYHFRDNRKQGRVPLFNVQRADTLASMNRIEKIVTNLKARLVIQHDPEDFRSLPKLPGYLE